MTDYWFEKSKRSSGGGSDDWFSSYGRKRKKAVEQTPQEKTEKTNQNRIANMSMQEQDEFRRYQTDKGLIGGAWNALTELGSRALDIVSRPEYAVAGAAEERMKRNQTFPDIQPSTYGAMAKRAGTELLSGIGDIQGKKKSVPDVLKQYRPEYKQFAEQHPLTSIGTDLGLSIGADPTTLIPAKAFAKAGQGVGKGIAHATKPLRATDTYKDIAKTAGTAFDTSYLWKKANASKGFDILWSEKNRSKALRSKLATGIKPYADDIATWEPVKIKGLIKSMYGDIFPDELMGAKTREEWNKLLPLKKQIVAQNYGDDVADAFEGLSINLRGIGSRELKYGAGHEMLENYFPNNPKQFTDLMQNVGEYLPSGHGRGLAAWKSVPEHGKVLRTGDDFLNWLAQVGVKDEDLAEVVTRNLYGRAGSSASRIRQIRTHAKWTREMPETFRELPVGKYKAWTTGESKVYQTTKAGKAIQEVDEYGLAPGMRIIAKDRGNIGTIKSINDGVYTVDFYNKQKGTRATVDFTRDMLEKKFAFKKTLPEGQRLIGPGESAWMPAGNLRFFKQTKWDTLPRNVLDLLYETSQDIPANVKAHMGALPKDVVEYLDKGGKLTLEMAEKLDKELVGVTSKVKAYAVPTEVLEAIDSTSKRMADANSMWGWYDGMINVFKNTAILSPFFHVRNFISSASQNYLADVKPARYKDAIDIFREGFIGRKNKIIQGKTVGGWLELMKRNGIVGGSFVGQQTGRTGVPVAEDIFKFNRWIGSHVEDVNRAPLFIDRMLKGADELEAAKAVKKYHFDYQELTDFEKDTMRRLMPFYSWQRNNVPLQLEKLFTAPQKYRNIAKLKRAIAGDPESKNNPEWWKENDVWTTKFNVSDIPVVNLFTKSNDRAAVSVGLPYSDLNQVLQNPTGSMGPAGALASLAVNYDPFYKKNIQEFKGQQETFVQIGDRQFKTSPRIKYALEHIVPVVKRYGTDFSQELSMIAGGKADDDTKLKALSKLIGVRIMPITKDKQDKQRIYKLKRELDDFTKYKKQQKGER